MRSPPSTCPPLLRAADPLSRLTRPGGAHQFGTIRCLPPPCWVARAPISFYLTRHRNKPMCRHGAGSSWHRCHRRWSGTLRPNAHVAMCVGVLAGAPVRDGCVAGIAIADAACGLACAPISSLLCRSLPWLPSRRVNLIIQCDCARPIYTVSAGSSAPVSASPALARVP
jgi:hypothetical protein